MDDDDFEADSETDAEVDAEGGANVDFKNQIPDEPLVPPAKHVSRIKKLSFSFVAFLLVLVGLLNLAMILWLLSR